ncbi:PEP-CTERM sorting domain-containing protein [Verrucomicrobiota bacterium]
MISDKAITFMLAVVFGFTLNAQAVYMLGVDKGQQDITLNIFDTATGDLIKNYSSSLPEQIANVVYAGDNVAYGFAPKATKATKATMGSTLYKFILSDDGTVNYDQSWDFIHIGSVQSIALVGDSLYAASQVNGKLYGIDLNDYSSELIKLQGIEGGVEGLSYNSADGLLYGIVADGENDELFSVDLSASLPVATTVGSTGVDGIESLGFGDDALYAVSGDTLHVIDVNTGSSMGDLGLGSWADDIEGLSYYSSGGVVPEPGSVLAWLMVAGGAGYMVRRKRAAA